MPQSCSSARPRISFITKSMSSLSCAPPSCMICNFSANSSFITLGLLMQPMGLLSAKLVGLLRMVTGSPEAEALRRILTG